MHAHTPSIFRRDRCYSSVALRTLARPAVSRCASSTDTTAATPSASACLASWSAAAAGPSGESACAPPLELVRLVVRAHARNAAS
eukprot:scaffold30601_cov129-Isochrysis_galbana.AAC.1